MPVPENRTHRLTRLRAGYRLLRWRELAVKPWRCPFCGITLLVRLRCDETGVRCMRCGASTVHLSLGRVLLRRVADLGARDACELSARGPLVAFLRRQTRSLATSEYFADARPGETRGGVRCEDVQQLTYADAAFDLITHTEVLEHVPDDARGLAELRRVMRPGGIMLFTVPLHGGEHTVERARLCGMQIEHVRPPVYHTDPLRGGAGILAFRDYGSDILERLRLAGFRAATLEVKPELPWGFGRAVIVAQV